MCESRFFFLGYDHNFSFCFFNSKQKTLSINMFYCVLPRPKFEIHFSNPESYIKKKNKTFFFIHFESSDF